MDRVPDYESVGCAFESRMAHHLKASENRSPRGFLLPTRRSVLLLVFARLCPKILPKCCQDHTIKKGAVLPAPYKKENIYVERKKI